MPRRWIPSAPCSCVRQFRHRLLVERRLLAASAGRTPSPRSCPAGRRSPSCRSSAAGGCRAAPARAAARKDCAALAASRLVKRANSLPVPSSPGLMKSKIDQRSPSRFSTGVPVSAMRARASSCLAARVCLAPGFLIACASSRTARSPGRSARSAGMRSERSVAGDHQIDILPAAPHRARAARAAGIAEGCAMSDRRPGAKRSISAAQLASSEAGATSRLVRRRPLGSRAQHQQQRQHLHRLAQPHVVGKAGAEAERRQQVKPAHAGLLIRTQRRLQRVAGIDARERFRAAKPFERLGEPGAGDDCDQSAARVARRHGRDVRARRAGASPRRTRDRLLRPPARPRETRRACGRASSRSTSTQRPRTRCRPFERRQQLRDLVGSQSLAVERDLHSEVEQRVRAEP